MKHNSKHPEGAAPGSNGDGNGRDQQGHGQYEVAAPGPSVVYGPSDDRPDEKTSAAGRQHPRDLLVIAATALLEVWERRSNHFVVQTLEFKNATLKLTV